MPRIYLTRNFQTITDLPELVNSMESILRDLERQLNAGGVITTRLSSQAALPTDARLGDIVLDYATGDVRVGIFTGLEFTFLTFGSVSGEITNDQHGARGRLTTGGDALHQSATTSEDGFMSAADKSKLDGIAANAAAVSNNNPTTIEPDDAASPGVSSTASRDDHTHAIATGAAVEITDSTNAEGVATSFSRSDHTHAHGDRGGGSLHAAVTTVDNGFMTATDKVKLDHYLGRTTSATPPTTTEYPADQDFGFHFDSNSGTRYFAWNDGGTIYTTTMI